MAMNVEAEIRDLKRRVGELEGSFGFLNEQVKSVHRDLLTFQERTEQRFDRIESKVDSLDRKIDAKVDGLARSLPGIMRDVLSDYEIKSKKG
jgi:archaellum component FlaC